MFQEVASLRVLHDAKCKVPKVLGDNTSDFETAETSLYFVMEYVPGETLADIVRDRGRLGLGESLGVVRDLCNTIATGISNSILLGHARFFL